MSVQGTSATVGVTDRTGETTTYANVLKRFAAFAIDELCIIPIVLLGYFLITLGGTSNLVGGAFTIAFGASIGFWNRCVRMGLTGQSWGKMVMGTRLLS